MVRAGGFIMRSIMAAAAAFAVSVSSVPAEASPTTERPQRVAPEQAEAPPSVEAVSNALMAYGAWTNELQAVLAPYQQALPSLQVAWGESFEGRTQQEAAAHFRRASAEVSALLDRTDAALAAMPTPDFPSLDLPEDARTASIVAAMRENLTHMRAVLRDFEPLLQAGLNNDMQAARRAGGQLMRSLGVLVRSQVVLMRASLVTTPREESAWELVSIQLIYFQCAERIIAAIPANLEEGIDRTLGSDLAALADQLDALASEGRRKAAAEAEQRNVYMAQAVAARDEASISLLRRIDAVAAADNAMFPLATDLAAVLRREAAAQRSGRVTMTAIEQSFEKLLPFRARLDEVVRQEGLAMAAE